MPFPPVFNFGALGDGVAALGACAAVEAEVALFIPGRGAVGVGRDGGVLVGELGGGGAGVVEGGGGEGAGVHEGEEWRAVRHWDSGGLSVSWRVLWVWRKN